MGKHDTVVSETEQHPIGDACGSIHCYIHDVDEPARDGDYRICHECFHVFRTAEELLAADRLVRYGIEAANPGMILRDPHSPADIHSCPLCCHDF